MASPDWKQQLSSLPLLSLPKYLPMLSFPQGCFPHRKQRRLSRPDSCDADRTITLVAHSYAFDEDMLSPEPVLYATLASD